MFRKSSSRKTSSARSTSSNASTTQSLLVPVVVSHSSKSDITTLPPPSSTVENTKSSRQNLSHNDSAISGASKAEKKRRRSLLMGSRFSVYSLFNPSSYSTVPKGTKRSMSHSANDLQSAVLTICAETRQDEAAEIQERECPLCCCLQPADNFPFLLNCSHRFCHSCLSRYLQVEIMENRIVVTCPECSELMHPNDIYRLISDHPLLLDKYEKFMVRRSLMLDPDTRWCPAPDCSFAFIATGCAACPELKCLRPGCDTLFCYHCKMYWHPNQTCTEAKSQRGYLISEPTPCEELLEPGDIKPCPRCHALIFKVKDDTCNHIVCVMCGTDFCWLCLKEISDLHYLSPSGCTFWGKGQWSRKEKMLWQFGILLGAPLGIALIAGFAVPAIIFGAPVLVGKKVHEWLKKRDSSKTKRRVLVTLSVAGSLLMGPVLATMVVGVGVPLAFAYVYGVIPYSLCRNGTCLTASSSGVRLDLDSTLFAANDANDGTSQEKTKLLSSIDNKSDAITLTSARSGSTLNAQHHKIQVQAEVTGYTKRRSSIESSAISLGDRVNYEDASVKALAGSTYYDDKSVHTMGSLVEGGSYCEERASTKALAGSVLGGQAHPHASSCVETKSLCGAKSVCSAGVDEASVRGLAGSICNESGLSRCMTCQKPLHGVTFSGGEEYCGGGASSSAQYCQYPEKVQLVTAAAPYSPPQPSGINNLAPNDVIVHHCGPPVSSYTTGGGHAFCETRVTKFADQLSLDSCDAAVNANTAPHCTFSLAECYEIDPYMQNLKILEGGAPTSSRHLSAIDELHACGRSPAEDSAGTEFSSGGGGSHRDEEALLFSAGPHSDIGHHGTRSSQQPSSIFSWKFLKKSLSWSTKLDADKSSVVYKSPSSVVFDPAPSSSLSSSAAAPHYKKRLTMMTSSSSASKSNAGGPGSAPFAAALPLVKNKKFKVVKYHSLSTSSGNVLPSPLQKEMRDERIDSNSSNSLPELITRPNNKNDGNFEHERRGPARWYRRDRLYSLAENKKN